VTEPVSVIVCTRNRAKSLRLSLESIVAERPDRMIIVDQSIDDASETVAGAFGSSAKIQYIHSEKAGLSRAYNLGIAAADTELLAFTDDDCTVPVGWLAAIVRAFGENPTASMMYGQVKAGDMELGPGDYIPVLPFTEIRRYSPTDRFEVFGMGANFAARRSDLLAVGGFDEALGGGGIFRSSQDSDMQLRLWRSGRTVLAHPGFSVDHFGARTPEQWQGTARAYGFGDGAFLVKHLRLRDRTAARLLASKALREAVLPVARVLKHRSYSPEYALGLCQGVRAGLRHPVDQVSRKYMLDA
jgi:GT2 family glycosyltransferase